MMQSELDQCYGTTKQGRRCRRKVKGTFCWNHADQEHPYAALPLVPHHAQNHIPMTGSVNQLHREYTPEALYTHFHNTFKAFGEAGWHFHLVAASSPVDNKSESWCLTHSNGSSFPGFDVFHPTYQSDVKEHWENYVSASYAAQLQDKRSNSMIRLRADGTPVLPLIDEKWSLDHLRQILKAYFDQLWYAKHAKDPKEIHAPWEQITKAPERFVDHQHLPGCNSPFRNPMSFDFMAVGTLWMHILKLQEESDSAIQIHFFLPLTTTERRSEDNEKVLDPATTENKQNDAVTPVNDHFHESKPNLNNTSTYSNHPIAGVSSASPAPRVRQSSASEKSSATPGPSRLANVPSHINSTSLSTSQPDKDPNTLTSNPMLFVSENVLEISRQASSGPPSPTELGSSVAVTREAPVVAPQKCTVEPADSSASSSKPAQPTWRGPGAIRKIINRVQSQTKKKPVPPA